MGNFEKMVVLAVLFLSAIVLAVSLNDDGAEVEASSPLAAAADRLEEQAPAPVSSPPAAKPKAESSERPERNGPGYLLHSETKSDEPAPKRQPTLAETLEASKRESTKDDDILKDTRGLRPAALPDFMEYDVRRGDTWNGLAMRFYGDTRYVTNLKRANDDMQLTEGKPVLVPVKDELSNLPARRPLAPEAGTPALAGPMQAPSKGGSTPPAAAPAAVTIGGTYVVQNGDSLSKIASKAYGNGKLWRPIFEANRDQMRTPDWLQVGMKLVIPDPKQTAQAAPADPNRPRVR